jgi:Tfp pilus assembly protein PilN
VIRTNLSTRPFYNTSAVRFWIGLLAVVVLAATVFNVSQVLRYSNSNTELVTRASNDEARAAELRRAAQRLRASVDTAQVDLVSSDARQANDLIERRTFSWTELFNRFERTLPDDVRITSVHPAIDKERRIVLTVNVLARGVDDVNQFMENLDQTQAFVDLRSVQEQTNEDGQIESALQMVYRPGTPPAADAKAAAAAPEAGRPAGQAPGGGR